MYTYCDDTVSDLHKDAYGFRPGNDFWVWWESATEVQKQELWDTLVRYSRAEAEEDARRQKQSVERFEALVATTISAGAGNRETALRWIMDASNCNGDWEFLCYEHGLPYGYFN